MDICTLRNYSYIRSSFMRIICMEQFFFHMTLHLGLIYRKTCLKQPLKKKTKNWFSRPIIA